MTLSRSEAMVDFDRSEDARRHRQYVAELWATRETVLNRTAAGGSANYLARGRVVRAIDELIAEASCGLYTDVNDSPCRDGRSPYLNYCRGCGWAGAVSIFRPRIGSTCPRCESADTGLLVDPERPHPFPRAEA